MGVAGAGKTVVGRLVAEGLAVPFLDSDDLHPAANVEKMRAGLPLDDSDRLPWLAILAQKLAETAVDGGGLVLACSALKRRYRRILLAGIAGRARLVWLHGSESLIAQRLALRRGHFMPAALLASQLAALEAPGTDEALAVDISPPPADIAATILASLRPEGAKV